MKRWQRLWNMEQLGRVLALLLLWLALADQASAGSKVRGIDPNDLKYFDDETLWCKDGSKSFLRERLNDNFCDCADGTDEPGTSACPASKYYCKNAGSSSKLLYASRVNDGICDCCDGSDEYERRVKCANTCGEAVKESNEKLGVGFGTMITNSNIAITDDDTGMLSDQRRYTLKFGKFGLKDWVGKIRDMKTVLLLQLLALFSLLCWLGCMWARVPRRLLSRRTRNPRPSGV